MRKLAVLTSFAALALLASPVVKADTLLAVDPPDVNIGPGTTADGTFDLNDFFNSTSGDVSYSAVSGGSVSGSVASVDGLGSPGETSAVFSGTNGTDTVEVSSSVFVSEFNIGNGADINNNNRLPGVAGGNKFAWFVAPGGSFSSAVPLSNLPSGGGSVGGTGVGGTGSGVTGGAALIQTIASVGLNTDPVTGLRERVLNGGVASGSNGGLTVELGSDGNYTVTAGASFVGNHIVTLGSSGSGGTDAVHVLASAATELGAPFVGTHTADAGAPNLVFGDATPIPVNGGAATVTVYYNTTSANAVVAAIGFDGALAGETVSFSNSSGNNIDSTGTTKGLSSSFTITSGSVIPAIQVASSGGAVSVNVVRMTVASAGPLHDFALNPNHKAASEDFSGGVGSIVPDILGAGASAPVADSGNKFASGAAGSMALNGVGGVSNGSIIATSPSGEVAIEAYVSRVGAADAGSALAVVATDGGATSISAFKPGSSVPEGSFLKVTVSGTVAVGGQIFLVVQAAGFNAIVDDVSLRAIDDRPEHFDADLLG